MLQNELGHIDTGGLDIDRNTHALTSKYYSLVK